jgi:hypothetical protein
MATPTADEVIRRVRALLQDDTAPERYSDSQLIDAINDGIDRMLELRPDYFILQDFTPTRVTATTSELGVPWRLVYPLMLFTAGYMMLREDEFSTDGRAVALLAGASAMVTISPGDAI